jgi:hypothetical protein
VFACDSLSSIGWPAQFAQALGQSSTLANSLQFCRRTGKQVVIAEEAEIGFGLAHANPTHDIFFPGSHTICIFDGVACDKAFNEIFHRIGIGHGTNFQV